MGRIRPTSHGIEVRFGVLRKTIPWATVNRIVEQEVPERYRALADVVLRSVEGHLAPAGETALDENGVAPPERGPEEGAAGGS